MSANGAQRFGLSPTRIYDPVTGRFLQNEPILRRRPFAHYVYSANNPIVIVDPSGAIGILPWTPGAHDELIQKAYENTPIDLNILKSVSAEQDNLFTGQSAEKSYQHGMMSPDQTAEGALKAWMDYLVDQGVKAGKMWCSGDQKGALTEFGRGVHALADSFSPMHRDTQGNPIPWSGAQHEAIGIVGTGLTTAIPGAAVGSLGSPIGTVVGYAVGFVTGASIAAIPTLQHTTGETLDYLNSHPRLKQVIVNALRDYYNAFKKYTETVCPKTSCPAIGSSPPRPPLALPNPGDYRSGFWGPYK